MRRIVEGLGLGLARRAARKRVPVVLTLGSGPSGFPRKIFAVEVERASVKKALRSSLIEAKVAGRAQRVEARAGKVSLFCRSQLQKLLGLPKEKHELENPFDPLSPEPLSSLEPLPLRP